MKVRISEASQMLGVSITTLRRWDSEGILEAERTPSGHRRYDLAKLRRVASQRTAAFSGSGRSTVCYARVSTPKDQDILIRQIGIMSDYCAQNGFDFEVIEDNGQGSDNGLRTLVKRVCNGEIGRLVVTHKGRLLGMGSDVIFNLCESSGTQVLVLNPPELRADYGNDVQGEVNVLVDDLLSHMTRLTANGKGDMMNTLREVAKQL